MNALMTAIKNAVRKLWMAGVPRDRGCVVPAPWWVNKFAWFGIAAPAVAIPVHLLLPSDAPVWEVLLWSLVALVPLMAITWVADRVDDRRVPWHLHCDDCGLCSIAVGVPASQVLAEADLIAADFGWYVVEPGFEDSCTYCPDCRDAHDFVRLTDWDGAL